VTQIRPHRVKQPKLCKRVIGYDANALYLSTMLKAMPCGKEKVVRYHYLSNAVPAFTGRLKAWGLKLGLFGIFDAFFPFLAFFTL